MRKEGRDRFSSCLIVVRLAISRPPMSRIGFSRVSVDYAFSGVRGFLDLHFPPVARETPFYPRVFTSMHRKVFQVVPPLLPPLAPAYLPSLRHDTSVSS